MTAAVEGLKLKSADGKVITLKLTDNGDGTYSPFDTPSDSIAVTVDDATDDPNGPFRKGLLLGTDGDVSFVDVNGNVTALTGGKAGMIIPVQVARVNSTGTTATVYGMN